VKQKEEDLSHNSEAIDRMYNDFLSRGGDQPTTIPQNLSRLESLATIHEKSAEVFLKIEELESHQAAIIEALKEDEEGLESVRNSMQNNMAIMRENLANLRARIEAVKK
jgi:nuclear migration protein JNM1